MQLLSTKMTTCCKRTKKQIIQGLILALRSLIILIKTLNCFVFDKFDRHVGLVKVIKSGYRRKKEIGGNTSTSETISSQPKCLL